MIATRFTQPLIALTLFAFGLSFGGCREGEPSPAESLKATGIRLTLPRALSAQGLKAEVAFYQAGSNPQVVGGFDSPDLKELDGELWVAGQRIVAPGSYLMRIYLSHTAANALLWAGEWSVEVQSGKETSALEQIKSVHSGSFRQFPGDTHPLITANDMPFGPDGDNNIDQVCTSDSCDGGTLIVCNENSFGSTRTDCSARVASNGAWGCEAASCVLNCDGDYVKSDDICSSECGDGIVTTAAGAKLHTQRLQQDEVLI